MSGSEKEPKPPAETFGDLIENDRRIRLALIGVMFLFLIIVAVRVFTTNPESTREVTRVSPENQVLTISILVPLVLIAVIELASVGREVPAEIVANTRSNRLTIVHGASGFFLLTAFDLTMKWGEFASGPIGMIIRVLWIILPLIEIGFYDHVFDSGEITGFVNFLSSSLMIHGIGVLFLTTYIEQKILMGFPSLDTPTWLVLAEGFFELFLLIATIFAFVWFVEHEAEIAIHTKTDD